MTIQAFSALMTSVIKLVLLTQLKERTAHLRKLQKMTTTDLLTAPLKTPNLVGGFVVRIRLFYGSPTTKNQDIQKIIVQCEKQWNNVVIFKCYYKQEQTRTVVNERRSRRFNVTWISGLNPDKITQKRGCKRRKRETKSLISEKVLKISQIQNRIPHLARNLLIIRAPSKVEILWSRNDLDPIS